MPRRFRVEGLAFRVYGGFGLGFRCLRLKVLGFTLRGPNTLGNLKSEGF